MLRSIDKIHGTAIAAKDGGIGKIHDFYFDDIFWKVRYIVAATGTWLPGRKVLLSPSVVGKPNWFMNTIPVALTRGQIENCPPYDEAKPVSRQYEVTLRDYYQWQSYWLLDKPYLLADSYLQANEKLARPVPAAEDDESFNPHLRSSREIMGYKIHARDGEIGHVEDFLVNDDGWQILHMVIDTRNWWPGGKKVLISPQWIEKVDWDTARVHLILTGDILENGPEFHYDKVVSAEVDTKTEETA